jgi:hypothetical protein
MATKRFSITTPRTRAPLPAWSNRSSCTPNRRLNHGNPPESSRENSRFSRGNSQSSRGNSQSSRENSRFPRGNSQFSRGNSQFSRENLRFPRGNSQFSRGNSRFPRDYREYSRDYRGDYRDYRGDYRDIFLPSRRRPAETGNSRAGSLLFPAAPYLSARKRPLIFQATSNH